MEDLGYAYGKKKGINNPDKDGWHCNSSIMVSNISGFWHITFRVLRYSIRY